MFRFAFVLLAIVAFCDAQQNVPAFRWVQEIDGSAMDEFTGIGTDAVGNVYVAGSTTSPTFPVKSAVQNHLASPGHSNCFVTKLDSSGNVVYSTYFGGSGGDNATAMTVDAAGNVYVAGTTGSLDFPTTSGAWLPASPPPPALQASSFLFKLNPDGTVGYSTYFAAGYVLNPTDLYTIEAATTPKAIAADMAGSVYVTGVTYDGVPITPGAYQTCLAACQVLLDFPGPPQSDGFITRFNPSASQLIYSTYLGVAGASGNALALASDGTAYVGASTGIYRMDAAGSSLLASDPGLMNAQAMAVAADGSVYVAGLPEAFQPTAGAFQVTSKPLPDIPGLPTITTPDAIARMDAQLQHILAGTYFYGVTGNSIKSLALDEAGNVYAGGYTSLGLPARTPFFEGFGAGFLSELSGDLSTLLFSSYFGADTNFGVQGVAVGSNGSIVIGGPEIAGIEITCAPVCNTISAPSNIWVNSLTLAAPAALRIDSIVNAASFIDGPISADETIFVRGAGFGSDAQLVIGGIVAPAISIASTQITAVVPAGLPIGPAEAMVQSGGSASNQVLVPITPASPGIFSVNGNGYGQGYILNQDGSLNTPSNPAAPGDRITIYATGVGPVSFTDGFAVTQLPSNSFIDGIYCYGVAALMGPVAGFPGDVYQLTIYVPNPLNFTLPALDPVILQMDGVSSQYGIAISIAQ